MYFLEDLKNSKNSWGKVQKIEYAFITSYRDQQKMYTLLVDEKKMIYQDLYEKTVFEYMVPDEEFQSIMNFIDEYHFPNWNLLENNPNFPFPGENILTFVCEKGLLRKDIEYYKIPYYSTMENAARKVFREFLNHLKNLVKEECLIKSYKSSESSPIPIVGRGHIPNAKVYSDAKFCPECGRIREDRDTCECGYPFGEQ